MIQATQIEITRAEGRYDECFTVVIKPHPNDRPDIWAMANRALWQWAETAPKSGGYDKCDFTVTFEDGETYSGRYDLVHRDDEAPDLAAHMLGHLNLTSGRKWPDHFDQKLIHYYQNSSSWQKQRDRAAQFLDTYQIGRAETANV